MKIRYFGFALALAALVSSPALAQTAPAPAAPAPVADVCSTLKGAISGQTTAGAATTTYYGEGGYGYTPEAKPEPKPANPVRKICDNGKVRITVGMTPDDGNGNPASHRHFGHTIMDKIPLTVVFEVDPAVMIDFTSLVNQRVIGFEGADFELYKPVQGEPPAVTVSGPALKQVGVQPDPKNPGKSVPVVRKVYVVNLLVQSMVFKPQIVFTLDLRYATALLPDGKTPNWRPLTTPEFVVSRTSLVDAGDELLEGDLNSKTTRLPWPTIAALSLGVFLMLLFPGLAVVKWLNRVRPRKLIAPNRMAWSVFEANHKDGKAVGFKVKHMTAFSHALRRYLASTPQYRYIDALTIEQIGSHFPDADPAQLEMIIRAIATCESEIFENGANRNSDTPVRLSEEQLKQLFNDLGNLVPRTWDSK